MSEKLQQRQETGGTVENFWKTIEKDTQRDLLATFTDRFERMKKNYTEEEIEERIQEMMERERIFVTQVFSVTERARTENPQKELTLLFDIDETLIMIIIQQKTIYKQQIKRAIASR